MVKFVSYNGAYPNLCSGKLILNIDGNDIEFPDFCMHSGGYVSFDEDWNEHVSYGDWTVDVPEEYAHLTNEIEKCVNENVPCGCCGGCI